MYRNLLVATIIAFGFFLTNTQETTFAEVRLANVFQDHAVLQRDIAIPIWGWAKPEQEIIVSLNEKTAKTKAGADGKWIVSLEKMPAGGPYELTVSGRNIVTIKDILIGEVWLCSGQSNMAMTVGRCNDFKSEQAAANHPDIRMFKTGSIATPEVQSDCKGSWYVCSPKTVGNFSGTAYFFGRKLHQELNVPVGLINSSWGGSDIAAWTSLPAQESNSAIIPKLEAYNRTIKSFDMKRANARYASAMEKWEAKKLEAQTTGKPIARRPRAPVDPRFDHNRPANLFNEMINPLIPYAIRGAIWYQGERNSHSIEDGQLYATQLQTLINDWRKRWDHADMPFITVQLPNYVRNKATANTEKIAQTSGWIAVRESQLKSLRLKNTGIAITTDIGDPNDIHPKNKQDVGLRLAIWALGTTYKNADFETYCGPLYSFHQYREHNVNSKGTVRPGRIEVTFDNGGDELKTSDGKPIRGFAIAGEDRVFHNAKATLLESGMLMLITPKVLDPVAIRYNWSENPNGNLINSVGLPAAPFRTDRWDLTDE